MLFLIFTEELHGGCHILSCDQMTSNMIGPLHAISFPGRLRIAEWQNVVCTLSIRISFCIKYRVYSYKFYSSYYVLNDICFVLTVRPEGHAIVRCKTWVCHELAYFHYWPWVPPFCMQWAWKIQIFKCQLIHSTIHPVILFNTTHFVIKICRKCRMCNISLWPFDILNCLSINFAGIKHDKNNL